MQSWLERGDDPPGCPRRRPWRRLLAEELSVLVVLLEDLTKLGLLLGRQVGCYELHTGSRQCSVSIFEPQTVRAAIASP